MKMQISGTDPVYPVFDPVFVLNSGTDIFRADTLGIIRALDELRRQVGLSVDELG